MNKLGQTNAFGLQKDQALWEIDDAGMVDVFQHFIQTDYQNYASYLAYDQYYSRQ